VKGNLAVLPKIVRGIVGVMKHGEKGEGSVRSAARPYRRILEGVMAERGKRFEEKSFMSTYIRRNLRFSSHEGLLGEVP